MSETEKLALAARDAYFGYATDKPIPWLDAYSKDIWTKVVMAVIYAQENL